MKVIEKSEPIYQGRLMSPNDVRAAVAQRGETLPLDYDNGWYLCGDVNPEFFRRVNRCDKIAHSSYIFRTGDTTFAVFMLQIRECQARFLLPIASLKSARFVEQVSRVGVFLSLGNGGEREAVLLKFRCSEGQLERLAQIARQCARLPRDLDMVELRLAVYSMTQSSTIPSGQGSHEVTDVCLSVILDD